jgi:subtilisin family serine protease
MSVGIAAPSLNPIASMSRAWYLDAMRLPAAWALSRGEGVRVGVLDGGVANVAGLSAALVASYDWQGEAVEPSDLSGHGTRCASLIASRHPDAEGAAPAVELVSIRVTSGTGRPLLARVVAGIRWATELALPIVSCSLTLPNYTAELEDAVAGYTLAGGLLVAAAGNASTEPNGFPRLARDAIVVGGVTQRAGRLAPLPNAHRGSYLDVCAPASQLRALRPNGRVDPRFGNTSGATALVAGVLALGLARSGSTRGLPAHLQTSARDVGPRGPDLSTGAGMVDAEAFLQAVTGASG